MAREGMPAPVLYLHLCTGMFDYGQAATHPQTPTFQGGWPHCPPRSCLRFSFRFRRPFKHPATVYRPLSQPPTAHPPTLCLHTGLLIPPSSIVCYPSAEQCLAAESETVTSKATYKLVF